jgi:hypothetical protein
VVIWTVFFQSHVELVEKTHVSNAMSRGLLIHE